MSDVSPSGNPPGTAAPPVVVRYWAAARAAAGTDHDDVSAGTLAEVLDAVRTLHAGNARFMRVMEICSVLVGERPVGATDPSTIEVAPGQQVELLPPFAGGAIGAGELSVPVGGRSRAATT